MFDPPALKDPVISFLNKRRHSSGGYTLYEGLPDSKNTYYAIRSFEVLDHEPPRLEETLDWLEDVHREGPSLPRDSSTGAVSSGIMAGTLKYLRNSLRC